MKALLLSDYKQRCQASEGVVSRSWAHSKWKPFELYTTDKYDMRANQFNVVHPAAPTECDAIRIKMTAREDSTIGITEVQVAFEQRHRYWRISVVGFARIPSSAISGASF